MLWANVLDGLTHSKPDNPEACLGKMMLDRAPDHGFFYRFFEDWPFFRHGIRGMFENPTGESIAATGMND